VDPKVFSTTNFGKFNCNAPGIANVTSTSHLTSRIVRSFLAGATDWQSIGTSPSSDTYLKKNGGAFFAVQNITNGYASDVAAVKWGNVTLSRGADAGTIFYTDFVFGAGVFTAVISFLGTLLDPVPASARAPG
jgi:hypothetical protein